MNLNDLESNYQKSLQSGGTDQPHKRNFLLGLLPTAGSILGSIVGTPIFGGAAGGSAGEALAELLGGEKLNVGKIAGEGALGGVGGGVGKLFGLGKAGAEVADVAANAGAKAAADTGAQTLDRGIGTTLRQSILKPETNNIFQLSNLPEYARVQKTYSIFGAPQAQAEKALVKFNEIGSQIQSTLSKTPKVANLADTATQGFQTAALNGENGLGRYIGEPSFQNALQTTNDRIVSASKSGSLNDLYNLKSKIGSEIRGLLEKQGSGKAFNVLDTPTQIELQVKQKAFDSLKNTINDFAPTDIKALNNDQHVLFDLGSAALGGAKSGVASLPVVGKLAGRPIQAATDFVGRGIQAVENQPLVQAAGKAGVLPAAAGQGAARLFSGGQNNAQGNSGQPQYNLDTTGGAGGLSALIGQTSDQPQIGISKEKAALAMLAYPKYASQIASAYNLLNPTSAQTPYGKPTAQQYSLAVSGIQTLQALTSLLNQDPGVITRSAVPGQELPVVGGFVRSAAGTGQYQALAHNVIDALLRLRTGAQANAQEIQLYQNQLFPQAGDNPDTVQTKLQNLQEAFAPFLNTGADTSNSGGLSSLLGQ